MKWNSALVAACLAALGATTANSIHAQGALQTFQTKYARIGINEKGFIASLVSLKSGKEYSPDGHPSPMMSLHEYGKPYDQLIFPISARFNADGQEISLTYPNGAVAVVKAAAKDNYFRFQLASLTPRGEVDNIIWGPLHTIIRGKMGDLIGVARDPDWAIGMFGLDDNTIAGPPVDGDCYQMGYYIHSEDPKKYPVPPRYRESQWFRIGGNGINDTAFYSHPEEFFDQSFGTGAKAEPEFGSTIAYHSRDRGKVYTNYWSLLPGFDHSRPRHQVSDPLPDVDFMGSAVALYACPDDQGLHVIENIVLAEGLPHIMIAGKWIRDPASEKPQLFWNGPYDRCIEYARALGLKDISRDTGEFYPSLGDHWTGGEVKFSNGRTAMSGQEFMEKAHQQGMTTFGGLHTLCLFLQPKRCIDVTPVASDHLQTVCRTHLAKDISETDTNIVVTDPSYLGEKGTWPNGDRGNRLRIGGEILSYDGITETPPYTLLGVKRAYATKATSHKAGDVVAKLQQNCYDGFCPDMTLMPEYASYYADLMARNGLESIDFDGLESTIYLNQGYYGVGVFFRRLFDTYAKLSGGKAPRVTASAVFGGAWLYMDACNVGGGDGMFDPIKSQWGTEGKDFRHGFENSYFPGTFGIQSWHSEWSLYDAENLEAKSIGWDATYALSTSQGAIDHTGEKEAILKAFHSWETARDENVFTPAIKEQLADLSLKFHLEQTNQNAFVLYPIKEVRFSGQAASNSTSAPISNPYETQPMQWSLRMLDPAPGIIVTLPDGRQIKSNGNVNSNQFIICKNNQFCQANRFRRKIADLEADPDAAFPEGRSQMGIRCTGSGQARFELTMWFAGKGEVLPSKQPQLETAK